MAHRDSSPLVVVGRSRFQATRGKCNRGSLRLQQNKRPRHRQPRRRQNPTPKLLRRDKITLHASLACDNPVRHQTDLRLARASARSQSDLDRPLCAHSLPEQSRRAQVGSFQPACPDRGTRRSAPSDPTRLGRWTWHMRPEIQLQHLDASYSVIMHQRTAVRPVARRGACRRGRGVSLAH